LHNFGNTPQLIGLLERNMEFCILHIFFGQMTYTYSMYLKKPLIPILFFAIVHSTSGQSGKCLPDGFSSSMKGKITLIDGTTYSGKFRYLEAENMQASLTTHIEYISDKNKTEFINRINIQSFQPKGNENEFYKTYLNKDTVLVKRECRYDLGVFLEAIVNGPYKLLEQGITYRADIAAYNQSNNGKVYYLVLPDKKIIKLNRNDLKFQVNSLVDASFKNHPLFQSEPFDIQTTIAVLGKLNDAISNAEQGD
jgi:hypothetical protein